MRAKVTRSHRVLILGALAVMTGSALALGACSTSSEDEAEPASEAGIDAFVYEAAAEDVQEPLDAGFDTAPREGGHCGPVQGPECDMVLQDCPAGRQCEVVRPHPLVMTTVCKAAGTGNRPVGAQCCPGQPNQCVAGLYCSGEPCTPDSGPTGHCSPYCCPGDDSICGQSIPEGYSGTCDIRVVSKPENGSEPLYDVCSYRPVCRPFRQQPCAAGQTCLLQKDNASFRCSRIYSAPGNAAGAPCKALNECEDGAQCLFSNDAGTCRTLCYRTDAGGPFDASALSDARGLGGCGASASCTGVVSTFPAYLGFCR